VFSGFSSDEIECYGPQNEAGDSHGQDVAEDIVLSLLSLRGFSVGFLH
jgi:hypothetical protein